MTRIKLFIKVILWFLNMGFLTEKILQWLFGIMVRLIGIFSAMTMLSLAIVFSSSNKPLWIPDFYQSFIQFPSPQLAIVFALVALGQLITVVINSERCQVILGCLLIISSLVDAVFKGLFFTEHTAIKTAMSDILLILICAFAGRTLIHLAKKQMDAENKEQ